MSSKSINFALYMKKLRISLCFVIVLCALALGSCGGGKSAGGDAADTLRLKYAEVLSIVRHADYVMVRVANPWKKGETLHTYLLVPDSVKQLPASLPEGTLVRTPLKRAVVSTTVHSQLFIYLHSAGAIRGVCDLSYVNIPLIQQRVKQGLVADCGSGMAPDVERVLDVNADAVLLSPFENNGGYGKLEKTGVPIIECADYMEPSPLARAEWMKFYGMLLGKEREADSLFNVVETNYLRVKDQAKKCQETPSVMIDKRESGVWYVPGGKSTIGQMIADAGGRYVFAHEQSSGSLALSLESVMDKAVNADIWLLRYSSPQSFTYRDLASESKAYTQFKAYKTHRVAGCNLMTSEFYEQTPFRPDWLIADFFHIFHPAQSVNTQLRYFHALQP